MSLSRYVKERDIAAMQRIDPHSPMRQQRPTRAVGVKWNFPAKRGWRR